MAKAKLKFRLHRTAIALDLPCIIGIAYAGGVLF